MTQFDAGPGDWSDREWEVPDKKQRPHVKRRRIVLPPWALLTSLIALVILLCVALIFVVRAIRGRGGTARETAMPVATATLAILPTETFAVASPTAFLIPTPPPEIRTVEPTPEPPTPTEIEPGATVVVKGTGRVGLNLRARPTTQSSPVAVAAEGTTLTVLEGPEEAGGHTWWKVETPDGKEGWGAAEWLVLKAE